jgi:hypothetical protein
VRTPTRLGLLGCLWSIAGCTTGAAPPTPVPIYVHLLTPPAGAAFSCPAGQVTAEFSGNADTGTAIVVDGKVMGVRWPPGYVGRWKEHEIEVLDPTGRIIATTGTRIQLGGGATADGIWETCDGLGVK